MSFKKSSILIIKGLTLEELYTVDKVVAPVCSKFIYDSIPKEFKSVEEWPKSTNLLCWYCDRAVIGYPRFIPKTPSISNGNDICEVIGNFDRWECAVAYAQREFSKEMYDDVATTIKIFANKFCPSIRNILPAPSKTEMKQYCGDKGLTTEEYSKKIDKKSHEIDLFIR